MLKRPTATIGARKQDGKLLALFRLCSGSFQPEPTEFMRMPRELISSRGGFTLIETVVGMGVIGVMVVSLYAALTSGVRTVQLAREDQRATQILVESMDQIRLFSWDQITKRI